MSTIARTTADVNGRTVSLLRGGPNREPILFLHGGVPGRTLYCGGAHLWADYLPRAAECRHVVAPDLPGFGDSAGGEPYRIDRMAETVLALIESLKLGPVHIVGHDEGGLIALAAALAAPKTVRSISIVASPAAAPTGDSIENLTLANPPGPAWSRAAQAWALDRLSYSPHHIDAALLDGCVACAAAPAHRAAVALAETGETARAVLASAGKVKGEFYTLCRDAAFPVPAQIVWGNEDRTTTVEHGRVLYGIIAQRQTATQFHLIARAGSFPFREAPEPFHHAVKAFHDGLAGTIL